MAVQVPDPTIPGGEGIGRMDGLTTRRSVYFAGVSITRLVYQFSVEGGWVGGYDGLAGYGGTYDPGASTPFISVAANKAVSYASALALVDASRGSTLPVASQVVQVLAEAVTEEAVRKILVVGNTPDVKKSVQDASGKRGKFMDASLTGTKAADKVMTFGDIDVLVINESLQDIIPDTLIQVSGRQWQKV